MEAHTKKVLLMIISFLKFSSCAENALKQEDTNPWLIFFIKDKKEKNISSKMAENCDGERKYNEDDDDDDDDLPQRGHSCPSPHPEPRQSQSKEINISDRISFNSH